jgi:hypothetical protein
MSAKWAGHYESRGVHPAFGCKGPA